MTALDVLNNILKNKNLTNYDFKYCLVDDNKHPFTIKETFARPNKEEDFVSLEELYFIDLNILNKYRGLGISIQASLICGIDIDHCVEEPFNKNTINDFGKTIVDLFKNFAYIEFSFSGTGIRIFFKTDPLKNYSNLYYTKNSKLNLEYYYPENSARYLTITGKTIYDNPIKKLNLLEQSIFLDFINKYMKRDVVLHNKENLNYEEKRSLTQLLKLVKFNYFKDNNFQNLWFNPAPGSGFDESERDYHLVAYLYDNITRNKERIKSLFEESNFFKTKDYQHKKKWNYNNYRYFNYLYDKIDQKK